MGKTGLEKKSVASLKDMTIRKQAHEALRQNEIKFREVVQNANSIIMRMDVKGKVTFFNDFAKRFFGYTEEEILGRNVTGTIVPETETTGRDLAEMILNIGRDPERFKNSVNENMRRNGERVWIAWTNTAIDDKDGKTVEILCIGNDITEQRKAEEAKKKLEAQLRQAQKIEAIGALAGGIAHDCNNLLQAVIGHTQMIMIDKEQGDPDLTRLLVIEKVASRASELIHQILTFSHKIESKLRPVDLNQEVQQVGKILKRTIPKMISLELNLQEELKIINADPTQLEQIMVNLGVNAKDAMPVGGKLIIETENAILDEEYCKTHLGTVPGEYVILSISDTGIGMDKETIEHIFEPFFTTKETGKGTGLGLSMVYGILKNHGGYITCYSNPGEGTTFKIYFPVVEVKSMKHGLELEEQEELPKGSETILLVDDESFLCNLGREMLERFGYTVLMADSGEHAIEIYKEKGERISIIILDLIMPGMGGKKCLEKLLRIDPAVKVVIASGYSLNKTRQEVLDAGAKGFISKPYELTQILKVIREALATDYLR
jgi:two-component system cell cycle sensor histidine kinase/response regulator CckA